MAVGPAGGDAGCDVGVLAVICNFDKFFADVPMKNSTSLQKFL